MYGYNPYTLQQTPQVPVSGFNSNRGELIRVTGFDGAKAYQMPPNSNAALFDNNEDIFYVKTTDGAGFPTIRAFRFTPMEMTQQANEFVTRDEFEKLRQEVLSYGKQSVSDSTESAQQSAE